MPDPHDPSVAIEEFRQLAARLFARQTHVATGRTWTGFLAEIDVLTPQNILPPADGPAEAAPEALPGFPRLG